MAATGRPAGHEGDPAIPNDITRPGRHEDKDVPIANTITCSNPTGPDAPGSAMPAIANTITTPGPSK